MRTSERFGRNEVYNFSPLGVVVFAGDLRKEPLSKLDQFGIRRFVEESPDRER